ncbi:hypothetical protein [Paludibacter sp.]|nr:hypothetical protein [Paludibacter sp.]
MNNMSLRVFTITKADTKGIYESDNRTIALPGKPYMAILLKLIK